MIVRCQLIKSLQGCENVTDSMLPRRIFFGSKTEAKHKHMHRHLLVRPFLFMTVTRIDPERSSAMPRSSPAGGAQLRRGAGSCWAGMVLLRLLFLRKTTQEDFEEAIKCLGLVDLRQETLAFARLPAGSGEVVEHRSREVGILVERGGTAKQQLRPFGPARLFRGIEPPGSQHVLFP